MRAPKLKKKSRRTKPAGVAMRSGLSTHRLGNPKGRAVISSQRAHLAGIASDKAGKPDRLVKTRRNGSRPADPESLQRLSAQGVEPLPAPRSLIQIERAMQNFSLGPEVPSCNR